MFSHNNFTIDRTAGAVTSAAAEMSPRVLPGEGPRIQVLGGNRGTSGGPVWRNAWQTLTLKRYRTTLRKSPHLGDALLTRCRSILSSQAFGRGQ
jgi:hypothetical protein